MTAKELKQYRQLMDEIKNIEAELSELDEEQTIDTVKASLTGFPYTEHSLSISGISEMTEKTKKKLNAKKQSKKAELEQLRISIENYINSIEDGYIRRIIRLKYLKGKSWFEVAKQVGGTQDSVRKAFERFFQKN